MRKRPLLWIFLLLALGILFADGAGVYRMKPLPFREGERITLYGTVEDILEKGDGQQIRLSKISIPSNLSYQNQRQVLVYENSNHSLKIGYRVKAEGEYQALKPASNPGQFDQKSYYEAQGIGMVLRKAELTVMEEKVDFFRQGIFLLQTKLAESLKRIAGEEEAALFTAMLLGDKGELKKDQKELYQSGGISHILAISGLHISLLGMLIYRALRKLKRSYGFCAVLSGGFMIAYGYLTGFGVSAERAILMFLVFLGAEVLGKNYDVVSGLAFAGILILLKEPGMLFQCGFQLSFLSVGAVSLVYPALKEKKGKLSRRNAEGEVSWKGKTEERANWKGEIEERLSRKGKTEKRSRGKGEIEERLSRKGKTEKRSRGKGEIEERLSRKGKTEERSSRKGEIEERLSRKGKTEKRSRGKGEIEERLSRKGKTEESPNRKREVEERQSQKGKIEERQSRKGNAEERLNWKGKLGEGLLSGISVTLVTLPCTLYWFYECMPYGILLNLVVIPLVPVVFLSGAAGMVVGCVSTLAGTFLAGPGVGLWRVFDEILRLAEPLPGSRLIVGQPKIWKIVVYYGILLAAVFWPTRGHERKEKDVRQSERTSRESAFKQEIGIEMLEKSNLTGMENAEKKRYVCRKKELSVCVCQKKGANRSMHWRKGLIIRMLAVATALLILCLHGPSPAQITFLDVGQGDGIFLRTAKGTTCFIDGGSSTVSQVGTYRILPFLKSQGVSHLDYLFLTHMDGDHINGARELLEDQFHGIPVRNLCLADVPGDETREKFIRAAKRFGTEILWISRGTCFQEKEFSLTCLSPPKGGSSTEKNENSLVLLADFMGPKVLLTGDLEGEGEKELLGSGLLSKVDVLKVAHHGSKGATSEEFLKRTAPKISMISVGEGNRYGHPAPELLERLEKSGTKIYLTQESGAITLEFRGKRVRIVEYCPGNG